jgi:hypothetical protein
MSAYDTLTTQLRGRLEHLVPTRVTELLARPALRSADEAAINRQIILSQYLIDTVGIDELVADVFVRERGGVVPSADFGFARWVGSDAISRGFKTSLANFDAAAHLVSNVVIRPVEGAVEARYFVQGWHWLSNGSAPAERNADFLLIGTMTDRFIQQDGQWRLLSRKLLRVGPGVAVGRTAPWLDGLGG